MPDAPDFPADRPMPGGAWNRHPFARRVISAKVSGCPSGDEHIVPAKAVAAAQRLGDVAMYRPFAQMHLFAIVHRQNHTGGRAAIPVFQPDLGHQPPHLDIPGEVLDVGAGSPPQTLNRHRGFFDENGIVAVGAVGFDGFVPGDFVGIERLDFLDVQRLADNLVIAQDAANLAQFVLVAGGEFQARDGRALALDGIDHGWFGQIQGSWHDFSLNNYRHAAVP